MTGFQGTEMLPYQKYENKMAVIRILFSYKDYENSKFSLSELYKMNKQ